MLIFTVYLEEMTAKPIFSATKKDFRVDWFSGTGKGGQYRNKHPNCCRITHIESGLMTTGQDHRERPANQKDAFNKLVAKLVKHYGLDESTVEAEPSNETIRTYHAVRNVVKDHASGHTQQYKDVVVDGEVGEMLEARKKALMGEEKE